MPKSILLISCVLLITSQIVFYHNLRSKTSSGTFTQSYFTYSKDLNFYYLFISRGSYEFVVPISIVTSLSNSKFLQHLYCFFKPHFTASVAVSMDNYNLFLILFFTILMLLNNLSVSVLEFGKVNKPQAKVALKGLLQKNLYN